MSRGGYVLKFISGKYQGGEFPLEMDSEIVIGRSSDLDMVLVEDMVSRRHARITSFNGELAIEDFGSTNGTFVNGERVNKARLKEGDRILVGTNIIKLVHRDNLSRDIGGLSPTQAEAAAISAMRGGQAPSVGSVGATMPPQAPQSQPPMNPNHTMTMNSAIAGMLSEVPLPDLLQLFSSSKRTGVLQIQYGEDTGKVYLRQGRVFFATVNDEVDVSPYKSFYRMMAWQDGYFSLDMPDRHPKSFDQEINESIEGLMMEGMRLLDEMHNMGGDVPPMSARLYINKPLEANLRELSPEQLDVFQLVFNYGKVSSVLNKAHASDLETMQGLLHLIRNNFITTGT